MLVARVCVYDKRRDEETRRTRQSLLDSAVTARDATKPPTFREHNRIASLSADCSLTDVCTVAPTNAAVNGQ